ncbi:MAG: hypothetical protein FJW76_00065 [Actinobacteria bacterium]|nr:hypothetical protein [Actinomycetota bacterium]
MAANKGRLRLVSYVQDSLGLNHTPKDIIQNENLDVAAAEQISSLRAQINELKKRRDLYSLSEIEIVALAGEHTLAIIKATKEAEHKALTEIERQSNEAKKESEKIRKQSETHLEEAKSEAEKLVAEAELRKIRIVQKLEQQQNETELKIKSQLDNLAKEVDLKRAASDQEARKIVDEAIFLANDKLNKVKKKIASELAQERNKIEQIRREAKSVAESLEAGYLSIRDQIDTARTTLGQYTSGLEDLTNLLSEQEISKED